VSKRKSTPGLQQALDRLASLFDWGELMAATDPAGFIQLVADEVERLRAQPPTSPDTKGGKP
jgi:hypothetical protein